MDSLRKNDKEFIRNNRLILKSQRRIRREKHNAFTEEVKRTRKDLVCIKRRN